MMHNLHDTTQYRAFRSTDQRSSAGFSLVEVLIAILVLAIGLLGLGAIFPAVIAEQRNAFSVIEGENVASSAHVMLENRELLDLALLGDGFNREAPADRYSYEWVVPQDGQNFYGWNSPTPGLSGAIGFATGIWSFDRNNDLSLSTADQNLTHLPTTARLFPQPYTGLDPKYVWDVALRREPASDQLQAAIFVRRIDQRIKVPNSYSMSDVLTNQGATALPTDAVLPVAIDQTSGRPVVDDGMEANFVYAAIQMLEVEVHEEHLNWLFIPNDQPIGAGNADTSINFATETGQMLVDNTGVVRTVVGPAVADAGDPLLGLFSQGRMLIVDPPFTQSQAGGGNTDQARPGSNTTDPEWDDERASWVRQVIFTPRTPVSIRVQTLEVSP